MNKEELRKIMIRLENTYFSEEEVILYFVDLYGLNPEDIDLLNDVNELFDERGYNCFFLMPSAKHKKFDLDEYCGYASKFVTKSKDKTLALIKYLKEVNSHRVTNTTLHLIKIKYLVDEGLLDSSNSYIKKCYDENSNLRDTLFQEYMGKDENIKSAIKEIKENILTKIGGYGDDYNKYPYYEFIVDTEYLLYSINNYKYSNMIKLMFLMVEEEYLKRTGGQYSDKFENIGKYLSMIKKADVKWYLEKHNEYIGSYNHDGYVQFYRHLEVK
ncbi:MAG: hypothetical protein IKJ30_01205 [Bacilli bacterium]|nr:hypothetical protein [Bacilli bacterium]